MTAVETAVSSNGHEANPAHIKDIIQAASEHDLGTLQECLEKFTFFECDAVDIQDPTTGYTPLHAAIASCVRGNNGSQSEDVVNLDAEKENSATAIVRYLLEEGAIWNQLDVKNETPGCVAYRLGLQDLYQLMVDAGVRAEVLLNRINGYEKLEEEEEAESEIEEEGTDLVKQADVPDFMVTDVDNGKEVKSTTYLSSSLSLGEGKLLDDAQNGVMMAWESGIMLQSTEALLYEPELRILNIGFGMGIIDSHIQNYKNRPVSHHIVEAHPDVLKNMKNEGWFEKPGVTIHEGKWQDVLPDLVAEGEVFDAIYFDTFAESYDQFREFFQEQVIGLLNQTGKWSFFNGMGADRQISYDVYQKVVELDLFESGFDVEWIDVELPKLDQEWDGVRRKYWNIDRYRLPVCKFMD